MLSSEKGSSELRAKTSDLRGNSSELGLAPANLGDRVPGFEGMLISEGGSVFRLGHLTLGDVGPAYEETAFP